MNAWACLSIAIVAEVIATSALRVQMALRVLPTFIVIVGTCVSFYFLALTLKTLPIGIAYAVWSGGGLVLITLFAWVYFDQRLSLLSLAGMGLIVVGVVLIQLFSKT